jgi:hypothetical protein
MSFLRIMFFQVWNMASMFWIGPIIRWYCQFQKFNSHVFPWIFQQHVVKFIFLMINFQVNQMCRFQQKWTCQYFLNNMCFKPSMIHYTWSLSNIPLFNIIPNGAEHILTKKQIMLYNTFNIYQNATLLLFILKHMLFVWKKNSNYVVLRSKHIFKVTILDN